MIAALLWAGCACEPAPSPASPDAVSTGDTAAVSPQEDTAPTVPDPSTESTGDTGSLPWVFEVEHGYAYRIIADLADGSDFGVGGNEMLAIDIDLDGRDELVAATKGGGLFVFAFDPAQREMGTSDAMTVLERSTANEMCAGDVDGDGDEDLVVYDSELGLDMLYVVLAPIVDGEQVDLLPPLHYVDNGLSCGDLNGDGVDDVVFGSGTFVAYYGPFTPGTSVEPHSEFGYNGPAGQAERPEIVPDFNGDGHADVLLMSIQQPLLLPGPLLPGVFADVRSYSLFPDQRVTIKRAIQRNETGEASPALLVDDHATDYIQRITVSGGEVQLDPLVSMRDQSVQLYDHVGDYNGDGIDDFIVGYSGAHEIFLGPIEPGVVEQQGNLLVEPAAIVNVIGGDFDGDGVREGVFAVSPFYDIFVFDFQPDDFRPKLVAP